MLNELVSVDDLLVRAGPERAEKRFGRSGPEENQIGAKTPFLISFA